MRMDLKVPFAEKDEAKKLGARWDAGRKVWYVEDNAKLALFARWSPVPQPNVALSRPSAPGRRIVGSAYAEVARVCACLPWEVCPQCRATALNMAIGGDA